MMTCPSCGYQEDTKFCKHCGAQMVSEAKANYLQAPQYTGVTIPPPTATQGFTADDIDEVGLEGRDFGDDSDEGKGAWFNIGLIVVLVVVLVAWAIARMSGTH
jgi:hypothetical protein